MYKKLFYATAIILAFISTQSCSKDNSEENGRTNYSVTIEKGDCRGAKSRYCITEKEKDRVQSLIDGVSGSDPCIWVSIKDINGGNHSGYYRSSGTDSEGVCN
jgi:hypothetical protein